jgi:nucleoside-diphosphate-sugar epimerase
MIGPVLIVGAGYVGSAFARCLRAEGVEVVLWTRTRASAEPLRKEGFSVVHDDAADLVAWNALPSDWGHVVICTASGGNPQDYDRVYRAVASKAAARLAPTVPLLFVSSTSVYAANDGSWVTESSLTAQDEPNIPPSSTRYILTQAERIVLARSNGQVARLTGIYGPGRTPTLDRLKVGAARLEAGGQRYMNHIHLDDILTAFRVLWKHPRVRCVNVADGNPATQHEVYQWLCERLKLPFPPEAPEEGEVSLRRRGGSHRRVSNEALRNLGWSPLYPSFREGYEAILAAGCG